MFFCSKEKWIYRAHVSVVKSTNWGILWCPKSLGTWGDVDECWPLWWKCRNLMGLMHKIIFKCKKIYQRCRRVRNKKLNPAMLRNFVAIPDRLGGWLLSLLGWQLEVGPRHEYLQVRPFASKNEIPNQLKLTDSFRHNYGKSQMHAEENS